MNCPVCKSPILAYASAQRDYSIIAECSNANCRTHSFEWWNPGTRKKQRGIEGVAERSDEAVNIFRKLCLEIGSVRK